MPPMRRPFTPLGGGPGMQASAAGDGQLPGQQPMAQPGRMNARPAMMMGGNGQPQGQSMGQPPMPQPPQLGAGGPTSPFNIESMLSTPQGQDQGQAPGAGVGSTSLMPETADGLMEGESGGMPQNTGPGNSMPLVMLKLMKMMGRI